jgi:uncharacterized protein DUF1259
VQPPLRRLALRAAVCAVTATLVATAGVAVADGRPTAPAHHTTSAATDTKLPVREIEDVLDAEGMVSDGVLSIDIDRSDLHVKGGPHRIPFKDGFQIRHELFFQSLGHGQAILNGDLALRPDETQRVIDALHAHHLVFQAFHQHLYDLKPMVWFVHYRGVGDPVRLARAIRAVIRTTHTPKPQPAPEHPTTPLPAKEIGDILGADATVGENGIVSVTVPRTDTITLGGVHISPELGVSSEIQFQPLGNGRALVVSDFSMTTREVEPVTTLMRRRHWQDGCLYNQETGEHPQLYFSHMLRTGDPLVLAHQIREALDRTNSQRA